jgi:hypothetical protein
LRPLRRSRPNRRVLDTLTEMDFQEAFQKWIRRWDRCLHARENYFEGDGDRLGLMVSFMIFTASVRNILDKASYIRPPDDGLLIRPKHVEV